MNPDLDLDALVEVIDFVENEDGSAILKISMSADMLVILARRGLQAIVDGVAEEYGYPNSEGDGDADARDGRDSELFGEIPEL